MCSFGLGFESYNDGRQYFPLNCVLLFEAPADLNNSFGGTMSILDSFPLEMVTCMSVTFFQQELLKVLNQFQPYLK